MQNFFDRVSERHHVQFIEEIRFRLDGILLSDACTRSSTAKTLVAQAGQRILNILANASVSLKEYLTNQVPALILTVLDNIVVPDESHETGLSLDTAKILDEAKSAIAVKVENELAAKDPDLDKIARLLSGNLGIAVITETILLPRLQFAHQAYSWRSFSS